jgi:tetratricopeptide (TPR) repeat protein
MLCPHRFIFLVSVCLGVRLVPCVMGQISPASERPDIGAEAGALPPLTTELAKRGARAVAAKRWDEARAVYQEMVTSAPLNPLALTNLGTVAYQQKDYPAAAQALETAVGQNPKLGNTWLTLGLVRYAQEQPMLALSALSRAVAEQPSDPRSRNALAAVLKSLGWTQAAEMELQKALDLNPESGESHFNLALLFSERRPPSLELCRRHYLRALDLGAKRDDLLEKQLAEDGANSAPEAKSAEQNAGLSAALKAVDKAVQPRTKSAPKPTPPAKPVKPQSQPPKP